MKEYLEKNGVSGKPTLEKCAKAKEKRLFEAEISSLDKSLIISSGMQNILIFFIYQMLIDFNIEVESHFCTWEKFVIFIKHFKKFLNV